MSSDMKILVVDIETSPNLVWTWGLWNQNIAINQIEQPTYMMCWAAKWVGQKQVFYRDCGDEDFLTKLWELLDDADAVVHWHGKRFDIPHINREFIEVEMQPPSPFKQIDLYETVKRVFKFQSNKLDFVAQKLLGEKKVAHQGFGLWLSCLNNEGWAWKKMKEYNIGDVLLTEKMYEKLLGWIPNHPNHGLFIEDQENPVCPNCASENIIKKGFETTRAMKYQRYKCKDCGKCPRGRQAVKGQVKTSKQVLS